MIRCIESFCDASSSWQACWKSFWSSKIPSGSRRKTSDKNDSKWSRKKYWKITFRAASKDVAEYDFFPWQAFFCFSKQLPKTRNTITCGGVLENKMRKMLLCFLFEKNFKASLNDIASGICLKLNCYSMSPSAPDDAEEHVFLGFVYAEENPWTRFRFVLVCSALE